MKLKNIHQEVTVNITPERMWGILAQYGDVSGFHAGVVESRGINGSENKAAPGCERICHIVDMGLPITLKERIIDYEEGRSYAYEVYEWKNFPIRKMMFRFTLLGSESDRTRLAIDIDYRAKPALLTPLLAGKMRRLAYNVLLSYKHYAETGQKRIPIKQLNEFYSSRDELEAQYG